MLLLPLAFMFSYFTVDKYEHCEEIKFATSYCENVLKPEYKPTEIEE